MSEGTQQNSRLGSAQKPPKRAASLPVTDRRTTTDESIRFQARLLDMVEQSVIATDLDGVVIYWNRFAQQLYGWTAQEAIGRQILELTTPEEMVEHATEIMSHLSLGESWTGEFNVQRRDGTRFPAQITNSPINNEAGTLIGIVGVSTDITKRKRIEAALRESENRYRLLVEQASDGIHTYDMQGNIIETNSKLCEMLGYTAEELLRLNVKDLIPAEDLAVDPIRFDELRAGKTILKERRLRRRDGAIFPVEISGRMIRENVLQAIIRDITERKRQEESLIELARQLERQSNIFDTTLSSITDFAYIFDREGRFLYANQPLLELWGLKLDEAVGKNFFELQYPEALALRLQQQIQQVIETGQVLRDETPYTSPTGAEGFYEYIFTPVKAANGKVEAVAGSTRDYTERKRVETALRESRERLNMAMNAAKLYSWEMNLATQHIEWSNNLERVIGFHLPADLTSVTSLVHSEDQEETERLIAQTINEGENYESEFRMVNPNSNEIVWVHGQGVLIGDAQNSPQRFVGITQNITERKHSEILLDTQKQALEMVVGGRPLAEVLEYLAGIVDHQSAGSSIASIMLLDDQGRLHTGAAPSLPADYVQAIEGIKADRNVGTCSAAAATGKAIISYDIAADPKWQDLKQFPLALGFQSAWSLPIMAADNRVLGTFGTYFRDKREPTELERQTVEILSRTAALAIERKQTEEALRDAHQRITNIFESITDCFYALDADWRFTYVNPQTEAYFNRAKETMLGRVYTELFPLMRGSEALTRLQEAMSEQKPVRFEVISPTTGKWVDLHAFPAKWGLSVYFRDISERKRAEAELKQINERLEGRVAERTAALSEMNAVLEEEVAERRRIEGERVELLRRIVFAQEDERRRIAREMHDQFGQQLTALNLKLDAVKEDCGDDNTLCDRIEALQRIARQLDEDVDHMVWEMRPTALDDLGLEAALSSYVENWSKHFGVPVQLHASGMDENRLTPEIETALYRIAQEALNNVAKHAHADHVAIVLERRGAQVSLIIEDDGLGFDWQGPSVANDKGLGLIGMRERAALVGGTIEIESQPGDGATIVVRIPVSPVPGIGDMDE